MYPRRRGHLDPAVGACKVAALQRWLSELDIRFDGKTVFEVGYGGGWCLGMAKQTAARVFGLEVVPENASHAARLGLDKPDLFTPDTLPERLPARVDLWLYLDAFEHLQQPHDHLAWVRANSGPGTLLLLVLPEAGSRSDRFLGGLWPHRLPDHTFHWSRRGLAETLGRFGFTGVRRFSPVKLLSLRTFVGHALHKAGLAWSPPRRLDAVRLWWNIGEQGLLAEQQ